MVIKWDLTALSEKEYNQLSKYEKKNFCHQRHVNRCTQPNVAPDFEKQANIALYDIKKGEELAIAAIEDF